MRRPLTLFVSLLIVFLMATSVVIVAQNKTAITVKGSEVVSGVILVSVVKDGKPVELQCNHGFPSCNSLKAGQYTLVELPPNHGMYECKDVEVYGDPATGADPTKKVGEYCLNEK